jgi:hypothetical protein
LRSVLVARLLPLLLLQLLLALPARTKAQFAYEVTNGTVTIAGYTGRGGAVVIPSEVNGVPVTNIGDDAFAGCTNLISVTIGNTVTNIGDDAFAGCSGLRNVTIPGSATTGSNSFISIGELAFSLCSSVTNVTISKSVSSIGDYAFDNCTNLISITIGNSDTIGDYVTSIGKGAFLKCITLTSVYLQGNEPDVDASLFDGDNYTTVYYLPGTTGWGPFLANRPALLWNPQVQAGSFGVRTNQFGFAITGTNNVVVVVEACTNLANPNWSPLETNTLNGNSFYFSDAQWTNYGSRFYRLRWP